MMGRHSEDVLYVGILWLSRLLWCYDTYRITDLFRYLWLSTVSECFHLEKSSAQDSLAWYETRF